MKLHSYNFMLVINKANYKGLSYKCIYSFHCVLYIHTACSSMLVYIGAIVEVSKDDSNVLAELGAAPPATGKI